MKHTWEFPYPSVRAPVLARNVVATSQPLAAQAGLQAMRDGGNAVDAALATAITLTVVEPNMNGIGSDAFAQIWDGQALHGLNASGRSPASWTPERFAGLGTMPTEGWDAVTVPGAVSAWVALSERFGRLPFERLFEPAVHYAQSGFAVGHKTAYLWQLYAERFAAHRGFMETFAPQGRAPAPGDTARLPDHARTLEAIAASKGESFYRGELARAIAADSREHGGAMTEADLAAHRADWVEPIGQSYRDVTLHEIPPNGQGMMALVALGILNRLDLAGWPCDSADSVHAQIEATRIAYGVIERHLADPGFMTRSPHEFLTEQFLTTATGRIDMSRTLDSMGNIPTSQDTVYLTAADAGGMMVSYIQSNYQGFGSGVVVPKTGISLQNRAAGFTLEAGHPNRVGGGKRPYHTIIPAFVTCDGDALMSFGVMGGHMQAQGHVQMMVRIFDYGQNPQAASDAPRWYLVEDGRVALEDGTDPGVADELARRGHRIVEGSPQHPFGGAQLISRVGDGYCGASDHRKEGAAVGF